MLNLVQTSDLISRDVAELEGAKIERYNGVKKTGGFVPVEKWTDVTCR
jgi:hypothetical protein